MRDPGPDHEQEVESPENRWWDDADHEDWSEDYPGESPGWCLACGNRSCIGNCENR